MRNKRRFEEENHGAHPIERVMTTAMTRLKDLVETDTIIGAPLTAPDGTVIIPLSKVTMGYVAGGGEYDGKKPAVGLPFAGGSGGGLSVTPMGFLIGKGGIYSVVSADQKNGLDKLVDLIPQLVGQGEHFGH